MTVNITELRGFPYSYRSNEIIKEALSLSLNGHIRVLDVLVSGAALISGGANLKSTNQMSQMSQTVPSAASASSLSSKPSSSSSSSFFSLLSSPFSSLAPPLTSTRSLKVPTYDEKKAVSAQAISTRIVELSVNYTISFSVTQLGYTRKKDAYTALVKQLEDSINDGNFSLYLIANSKTLQDLSEREIADLASSTTSSSLISISKLNELYKEDDKNDSNSIFDMTFFGVGIVTIGIALCGLFCFCLVVCCGYNVYSKKDKKHELNNGQSVESEYNDNDDDDGFDLTSGEAFKEQRPMTSTHDLPRGPDDASDKNDGMWEHQDDEKNADEETALDDIESSIFNRPIRNDTEGESFALFDAIASSSSAASSSSLTPKRAGGVAAPRRSSTVLMATMAAAAEMASKSNNFMQSPEDSYNDYDIGDVRVEFIGLYPNNDGDHSNTDSMSESDGIELSVSRSMAIDKNSTHKYVQQHQPDPDQEQQLQQQQQQQQSSSLSSPGPQPRAKSGTTPQMVNPLRKSPLLRSTPTAAAAATTTPPSVGTSLHPTASNTTNATNATATHNGGSGSGDGGDAAGKGKGAGTTRSPPIYNSNPLTSNPLKLQRKKSPMRATPTPPATTAANNHPHSTSTGSMNNNSNHTPAAEVVATSLSTNNADTSHMNDDDHDEVYL